MEIGGWMGWGREDGEEDERREREEREIGSRRGGGTEQAGALHRVAVFCLLAPCRYIP